MSEAQTVMEAVIGSKIIDAKVGEGGFHLELDGGYTLVIEGSFVIGLCQLEPKLH